jgi:hypothetical protein
LDAGLSRGDALRGGQIYDAIREWYLLIAVAQKPVDNIAAIAQQRALPPIDGR